MACIQVSKGSVLVLVSRKVTRTYYYCGLLTTYDLLLTAYDLLLTTY